jgi:hypothetical protein
MVVGVVVGFAGAFGGSIALLRRAIAGTSVGGFGRFLGCRLLLGGAGSCLGEVRLTVEGLGIVGRDSGSHFRE